MFHIGLLFGAGNQTAHGSFAYAVKVSVASSTCCFLAAVDWFTLRTSRQSAQSWGLDWLDACCRMNVRLDTRDGRWSGLIELGVYMLETSAPLRIGAVNLLGPFSALG